MMMSKQKKITYFILFIVLVGATIGVLMFGRRTVVVPDLTVSTNINTTASGKDQSRIYTLPEVFPAETKFNTSVFKSSTYQTLQPPQEVKVEQSELGRENPFKQY